MTAALRAEGLGKKYRRQWALTDCTLDVPAGRVVGLVGPNGAGKSTLLNMAVGLLSPTTGSIEVLGGKPASSQEQLAKVGFVAQDTPTYAGLSVADHMRLGAHLNPGWDDALAERADPAARPGPGAPCREALRRTARPARPDLRHRGPARAADPRRAGREPRPAGPAGVPAGPDGGRRRAGAQRRALLPRRLGRGPGLRLPDRARRLPRQGRRRHRDAAGHPLPAHRSTA